MKDGRGMMWRSRWAAVGAAVAVTLGAGGVIAAHAGGDGASSFVPITPCRLLDTRADSTVGTRSTPLGSAETATFTVQGANGNCNIPSTASAVAANATVVNGTAASFLTLWPSDQTKPTASSLNWTSGQAPTPNKVDIKLSTDGKMSAFNNVGTVNLIVDVVGYYKVANPGVDGVEFARNSVSRPMASGVPFEGTRIVVSAPFDGFVTVNATAQLTSSGSALLFCDVEKTATVIGTEGFALSAAVGVSLVSGSKGFPVTAGDTTFYLMCVQQGGTDGTVAMDRATVTASYSITRA